MNTKNFLISGLAGGVAVFIFGFLIYGMALMGYFEAQSAQASSLVKDLAKDPMVWWAMIAGNIVWGLFLAYIFVRWAGITTFVGGAKAGAIIGLLSSLASDLMMYAQYNMTTLPAIVIDVAANVVLSALVGGVIGWVLGKLKN